MEKWPQSDLTCYLHRQNVCPKKFLSQLETEGKAQGRTLAVESIPWRAG